MTDEEIKAQTAQYPEFQPGWAMANWRCITCGGAVTVDRYGFRQSVRRNEVLDAMTTSSPIPSCITCGGPK